MEEHCHTCYWAYPEDYAHIAMRDIRRIDVVWTEGEVEDYERLKRKTIELQQDIPSYVKEIVKKDIDNE